MSRLLLRGGGSGPQRSRSFARAALLSAAALLCITACDDSTGPPGPGAVRISVSTTQGIAQTDYAWTLDGSLPGFVGGHCRELCDWSEGDVLGMTTRARVAELAAGFLEAGILDRDGADYGVQCCDQHYLVLTYTDGHRSATIRGSTEAFPDPIKPVVDELLATFYMAHGGVYPPD